MPLYKPSELFPFLESLGIEPKKSLSQNFLIDGNIIRKIVQKAEIAPGDPILEIGPGPGCLTEALVEKGADIVAVEMDDTLAHALRRFPSVKVIARDALQVPVEELFHSFSSPPSKKLKLIANLPYHITTPLLARFVPFYPQIESIIVMVQEEVARRITAMPGTAEYGSISLFLSFYADLSYLFKVGRRCFYPSPKVDSAVIMLKLKQPPSGVDPEQFFILTRAAFQQRRKSLRSSLKELYPGKSIEEALKKASLPPLARPEELSLKQFLDLYFALNLR